MIDTDYELTARRMTVLVSVVGVMITGMIDGMNVRVDSVDDLCLCLPLSVE